MWLKRVKIRALNYEKLENLIQKTSPDRAAQPLLISRSSLNGPHLG